MRLSPPLRALLAGLSLVACAEPPAPPTERPSLILVSIDTLRADHVGVYGYERDTTPNLDRWAEGAIVFERAYALAAWTLVSHMTMLTGLFPAQHGVIGQNRALSPDIPLIAERLKAAGYRTYALHEEGAWIDERHGFERGFDLFEGHSGLEQADAHLRTLLPELEQDGPFFLFLHVFDVHCGDLTKARAPYEAPEPFQSMFSQGLPPLPDVPLPELWKSKDALTPEQLQRLIAEYDAGIRHVDDQLGRWLDELERRGLARGALTIVTADHGEALGQHGKLNEHGDSWQAGLHVPLIVRTPDGRGAGTRVSEVVHLGDLVPTLLEAAGLPGDERLPGVSLLGRIPAERVVFGVDLPEAFVLRWPEKIVAGRDGKKATFRATDLARDPEERAPTTGAEERFEELKNEALAPGWPFPAPLVSRDLDPATRDALAALGYAGETGASDPAEEELNEELLATRPSGPAPEEGRSTGVRLLPLFLGLGAVWVVLIRRRRARTRHR
ncbi:MAG TPA: sulfatase [Planctomycetota bacterium]